MNPVKPDAPTTPGWTASTYAENQPEYLPLPVVRKMDTPEGVVVSVWEPDATEIEMIRRMIEEGRPVRISIELWTFRKPLSPMRVTVGNFPEPYQPYVTHEPSVGRMSSRESNLANEAKEEPATGRFETDGANVKEVEKTKQPEPHWSEVINQPPVQDGEE